VAAKEKRLISTRACDLSERRREEEGGNGLPGSFSPRPPRSKKVLEENCEDGRKEEGPANEKKGSVKCKQEKKLESQRCAACVIKTALLVGRKSGQGTDIELGDFEEGRGVRA